MIKCRIGLVSYCKDHDFALILGELFDKNIRDNINMLYELHKALVYSSNFYAKISGTKVITDNTDDLCIYQRQYKITNNILVYGTGIDGEWRFSKPCLYDLDCMIFLFNDTIQSPRYNPVINDTITYILVAEKNPLIRGTLVEECFRIADGKQIKFYIVDDVSSNINSCVLTKRYLMSQGITDVSTIADHSIFDNIFDIIQDTSDTKIYIIVNSERVQSIARYIRLKRSITQFDTKIVYVCNS
jgi:hypothetical protein